MPVTDIPLIDPLSTPWKPWLTLDQVAAQLQTQWGGAREGDRYTWTDSTVYYSIVRDGLAPQDTVTPMRDEAAAFSSRFMTDLMYGRAQLAFELWDDLIAIDLTPSPTNARSGHVITFAYQNDHNPDTHDTYTPFTDNGIRPFRGLHEYAINSRQVWMGSGAMDSAVNSDAGFDFGDKGFQTYLHEIGNALGLSHPGSYDSFTGGATYAADAEYIQDTQQYTLMSYFRPDIDHIGSDGLWSFAATPLLHDIVAIQDKYGADMTTRTGNTV